MGKRKEECRWMGRKISEGGTIIRNPGEDRSEKVVSRALMPRRSFLSARHLGLLGVG